MTWPWVARSTLDEVREDRNYLREQLAQALDHNRRLERKEAGLTEQPKEPRPSLVVPGRIVKIAEWFGSHLSQQAMLRGATQAYADKRASGMTEGEAWDSVAGWLVEQLNVEEA